MLKLFIKKYYRIYIFFGILLVLGGSILTYKYFFSKIMKIPESQEKKFKGYLC